MKAYWNRFLHWQGWKVTAAFFVRMWKVTASWRGWKIIFGFPFWAALVLFCACCVGLIWVFLQGYDDQLVAYCLYPVSAYALTALCVKLPAGIRSAAQWKKTHPERINAERKFQMSLYFEQIVNFAYGIFKTASGVMLGSAWVGCDGIYNLAQALIQLFQILKRKNPGDMGKQWRSYRACGVLILLMHLTLTGIVFQMVNQNRANESGEIQIIATAAFAFYKIITRFVDIAKDRKHTHPVDSSVRMLELTQAVFAMFSLQASMLHTFGTGEPWEHWLNAAVGCAVCLCVCATGIYMIHRGSREIRTLQETKHGE